MQKNDSTTHVVVALLTLLFEVPALLAPWQGPKDSYKVLLILGPLAIIGIALAGRRQPALELEMSVERTDVLSPVIAGVDK